MERKSDVSRKLEEGVLEALNLACLLDSQEEIRSRSEFRERLATQRSRTMLLFAWRGVR